MSPPARLLPGIPLIESPLFEQEIAEAGFTDVEVQVARDLNRKGFAVIDFSDDDLEHRINRMKAAFAAILGPEILEPETKKTGGDKRIQDAWLDNDDVRAIACNQHVLDLLSRVYGRQAFPFQTLNFPVGTQQPLHTDAVHFSSLPSGFMCGVWLAMEDIQPGSGPLRYLPGSHKWPMISNIDIGRRGHGNAAQSAQSPFHDAWDSLIKVYGAEEEIFLAKRGQALIWTANLLHGGSRQIDETATRWSQVTHYYFDDCIYYTPAFSDEVLGQLMLRTPFDVRTGAMRQGSYLGESLPLREAAPPRRGKLKRALGTLRRAVGLYGGSAE